MAKKKARSKNLEPADSTHHLHMPTLRSIPPRPPRKSRRKIGNRTTTSGGPRKNTICFYCREKGHEVRRCPKKKKGKGVYPLCSNTGCCAVKYPQRNLETPAKGAIATDLNFRKGRSANIKSPGHMYQPSHNHTLQEMSRRSHHNEGNSSSASSKSQGNKRKCFYCHDSGHYAKTCPIKRKDKQIMDAVTVSSNSAKGNPNDFEEEKAATTKVLPPDQEASLNYICKECGKAGIVMLKVGKDN